MKEVRDKIDVQTRTDIEASADRLKRAMKGENTDEIRHLTEELKNAS